MADAQLRIEIQAIADAGLLEGFAKIVEQITGLANTMSDVHPALLKVVVGK